MKIACLLPSLRKKGPVIVAFDIFEALSSKIEQFDFFYFTDVDDGIDQSIYNKSKFIKLNFFKAFDFEGYDILHTHSLRPDVYTAYFKNKIKPPVITTVHNYVHEELLFTYNNLVAIIFSKVWIRAWENKDALVFLSNHMKNYYVPNYIVPVISKVIHNGLRNRQSVLLKLSKEDESLMSAVMQLKRNHTLLGACGVLNKRKGFNEIIDFLILNDSVAVLFVGDGPEFQDLQKHAKQLGVEKRCFFLGFRNDVSRWMKLFDIYVMSSHSEGFPLVMLEAAQLKVPILCVNSPLFNELFDVTEVVFYNRKDKSSIKDSLEEVINNKNYYSSAVYFGATDRYGSDQLAKKYLNVYKETTKR